MKRFLLSIILCTILLPVLAQNQQWSLEKCINFGIENSIQVKQYELAQDNQAIELQSSKLASLPGVSANIGENGNIGRAQNREGIYEDHTAVTTSLNINASMSLFQGGRISNQIKAGEFNYQAAIEDLKQAKDNLAIQIVGCYLQALYNKEIYKVAERQLNLNREQIQRTKILVDAGNSSESELFEAEASLAKQQSVLIEASNNLRQALLELAQIINLQDIEGFDIDEPDVQYLVDEQVLRFPSTDEIYQEYVNNKPSVKAAQMRVDAGQKSVSVAKSAYYPSLSLGASYGTSYYYTKEMAGGFSAASLKDQFSQNGATIIGLSLQIPIFNRMATRNSVKQAELNVQNQQLQLEQEKLSLYKEIQQARTNAEAALYQYFSAQKSEEASQKAYEYESIKYESGRSSAYQFNEVRQRLFSAQSDVLQAKYNFLLRTKILNFYQGEPLF